MQKSLMKLLGVAVLTWSSQISAVSMGGINVSSTLGQPLKASIPLNSVSETEKSGLTARLASAEAYKIAGLDYPSEINFKFEIDESTRLITVTSNQSINVPFISLLIELNWASGKLVRDYTFLIDPEGYTAAPAPLPAVQPIAPEVQASSAVQATPIEANTVESRPIGNADAQDQKVVGAVNTQKVTQGTVKIQRGDTLNKIAAQNKPTEVSLDRMMVALYRANAQKFVGHNMNRIKTGTILRLPSQTEVDSVSVADARKEIHAQAKDWNAYRQQLASNTSVNNQSDNAQQTSAGKVNANVTDKTPVASDTAKEVLKLSSGSAPNDKTTTTQDKQNAAQEDAIAKAKAVQDEQTRAALAAKNAQDAQHLLDLKSQAGMLASSAIASASQVASTQPDAAIIADASAAASTVGIGAVKGEAMSGIKPVMSASAVHPVTKPTAKAAQPENSLVDDVFKLISPMLDMLPIIAGGLAALLGLGGLVFFLNKRKKQAKQNNVDESSGALAAAFNQTDDDTTGEPPSEDPTGEATAAYYQVQNAASYQPIVHEETEEDPIEEARLFLSFGRDAQAEDILKDALKKTPNNYQLHLELLGIYAHRKDVSAFTAIANQIKAGGDESLWTQAAALGRKLDPSNTLYADGKTVSEATIAHLPEPAHSVDFDLGVSTNSIQIPKYNDASDQLAELQAMMDFGTIKSAAAKKAPANVDLHVGTAEHPIVTGEIPNRDEMIFDITASHSTFEVTPAKADEVAPAMAFPMDLTISGKKAATPLAAPSAPTDNSDMPFTMDFAMPDLPHVPSAPIIASSEPTSMPFTIDFAMPDTKPATISTAPSLGKPPVTIDFAPSDTALKFASETAPAIKLDFGGIDLEMGGATTSSPNTQSAAYQEIANKLDLAKVYIEMDDPASAREFLDEVVREGNPEQISSAQEMLRSIS